MNERINCSDIEHKHNCFANTDLDNNTQHLHTAFIYSTCITAACCLGRRLRQALMQWEQDCSTEVQQDLMAKWDHSSYKAPFKTWAATYTYIPPLTCGLSNTLYKRIPQHSLALSTKGIKDLNWIQTGSIIKLLMHLRVHWCNRATD